MATSVAQAEPAKAAPRGDGRVVAAVAVAVFCVDVDFFALNLALPATACELNVTTTDLQWAIAVYQLTLASFLIPGGRRYYQATGTGSGVDRVLQEAGQSGRAEP